MEARIGSAPQKATCHDDRSSSAIWPGLIRSRHIRNAKSGAPLMVARWREIARSQRDGLATNFSGENRTSGTPL